MPKTKTLLVLLNTPERLAIYRKAQIKAATVGMRLSGVIMALLEVWTKSDEK